MEPAEERSERMLRVALAGLREWLSDPKPSGEGPRWEQELANALDAKREERRIRELRRIVDDVYWAIAGYVYGECPPGEEHPWGPYEAFGAAHALGRVREALERLASPPSGDR